MSEKKHKKHSLGGHGHGAVEKDESEVRWLISYSDFMMQLVCLFILLYSVSAVDISKAAPIAQAWREEVGLQSAKVPWVPPNAEATPLTMALIPATVREIEISLGRLPEGKHIRVSPTADGFQLQLVYDMFESGSSELTSTGIRLVELAAFILKPYQTRVSVIEITGHTAAEEGEAEKGSPLKLSLSRARSAYHRVSGPDAIYRLDAHRLTAAGRGPHLPVEDNANAVTRPYNRRVDFAARLIAAPK